MTIQIKHFNSEVNNTEDYGTHAKIEALITMGQEGKATFLLLVSDKGCWIREQAEPPQQAFMEIQEWAESARRNLALAQVELAREDLYRIIEHTENFTRPFKGAEQG